MSDQMGGLHRSADAAGYALMKQQADGDGGSRGEFTADGKHRLQHVSDILSTSVNLPLVSFCFDQKHFKHQQQLIVNRTRRSGSKINSRSRVGHVSDVI